MDPNACLQLLISSVKSNDIDQAKDSYEDLNHWITNGGFKPEKFTENTEMAAMFRKGLAYFVPYIRSIRFSLN